MEIIISKLMPTTTVLSMIIYCCWPEPAALNLDAMQGGDPPNISLAMLSPEVEPETNRDPFRSPAVAAMELKETADRQQEESVAEASPQNAWASGLVGRLRRFAHSKNKMQEITFSMIPDSLRSAFEARDPRHLVAYTTEMFTHKTKQPISDVEVVDPLKHLTLSATFIGGLRRLAIINDRLYQVGEPLAGTNSPDDEPCVLSRILSDKVLIEQGGLTRELTYWNAGRDLKTSPAPDLFSQTAVLKISKRAP